MKKSILFLLLVFATIGTQAASLTDYLTPQPQRISYSEGEYIVNYPYQFTEIQNFLGQLRQGKFEAEATFHYSGENIITLQFITSDKLRAQHYVLAITPGQITLTGGDEAALFYAAQTLSQIFEYALAEQVPLPCLVIEDWPDFERRGYMLDISRDKVPTMPTLFRLIDQLAKWKINEVQLYTEHTFAYHNHRDVWKDADPLTAKEIQLLDRYCRDRFIDLVPNQNSFGHMENWLKVPRYQNLAECPDDCATKWGKRKLTSLDPTNPGSLKLMRELYEELLPIFSSNYVNIGCDETVELGLGRSKAACDTLGTGRVYLNYLKQLNHEVNRLGKQAQFWGDIITNHSDLIGELPQNMTAMAWGYDIGFPFDTILPKFKAASLDFYVCPGAATWRSLIGRNHTAFTNIKEAAIAGKANGAKGLMLTDWGDYGHWQPMPVSWPAIVIGSSYAWKLDTTATERVAFQLNRYIFKDTTQLTANALLALGDAYLKTEIPEGVANAFHLMLHRYKWTLSGNYQTRELTVPKLQAAENAIDSALNLLQAAQPQCLDAQLVKAELTLAASLAKHAVHLGIARLNVKGNGTKNIPWAKRQELAKELKPLIDQHKKLWVFRNRKGGLDDSASKLEEVYQYYIK